MSIDKAREYLKTRGMEDRILEFECSTATVHLAAEALGVEPAHIAKSLTFRNKEGDGCIMLVAAGDARIDNKAFKEAFGLKPRVCTAEEAVRFTGHAVGGVCPFAVEIPVYLDESLKRFETVFPAAGNDHSAVRLTPDELFGVAGAKAWVTACKL